MIPVKVKEVVLDQSHNPLLLLADLEEDNVLPLGIGFWEAQAIIVKLQGNDLPRPMTHDLLHTMCQELGAKVSRIVISDINENTFFAELYLKYGAEEVVLDARPSDAVALALTADAPVFMTEKVSAYTIPMDNLIEDDSYPEWGEDDSDGPHLH